MAEATKKEKIPSLFPDWSQLPEELLHLISMNLENCFDVVHARSVCTSWRSTFPFPSCLLRPSYSLPKLPFASKDLCTLKKTPLFLFRRASTSPFEYFVGGIGRDETSLEVPSPLQCSVKIKFSIPYPILINTLDCEIIPLGYQYIMISCRCVAFLPLDKEGGGEFVVLISNFNNVFVLRSGEKRWRQLEKISTFSCKDIVTFRGKFYASDIFAIDPYSLEATPLMPSKPLTSANYLIPSGNDELFLVEKFIPVSNIWFNINWSTSRVSRLDEETGKWVVVNDLGNRVLFINEHFGNVFFSAKELPHSCGVTGNSILFTDEYGQVTFAYKYGVHTERAGDVLNMWNFSRENRVMILNRSPGMAFRIECQAKNLA